MLVDEARAEVVGEVINQPCFFVTKEIFIIRVARYKRFLWRFHDDLLSTKVRISRYLDNPLAFFSEGSSGCALGVAEGRRTCGA